MTRLHPDDIRAIAQEVASMLGFAATPKPQQMSIADQAIMLARQGKIEESKQLLKAHSKRRAA